MTKPWDGICRECGRKVSSVRVAANPPSRRCIGCQEAHDAEEVLVAAPSSGTCLDDIDAADLHLIPRKIRMIYGGDAERSPGLGDWGKGIDGVIGERP